jgi:hypothetical protein
MAVVPSYPSKEDDNCQKGDRGSQHSSFCNHGVWGCKYGASATGMEDGDNDEALSTLSSSRLLFLLNRPRQKFNRHAPLLMTQPGSRGRVFLSAREYRDALFNAHG